jgi:tetratricopeptide (TPR) repeat protein
VNEHPTAAELRGFLEGQLTPERRRVVITHLLQGCEVCSSIASNAFGYLPVGPNDYDAVTQKVVRRFSRAVKREREKAREVVAHLEQGEIANLRRRFHGLALYEELLARSWALRHENPSKMIELARHATLVARNLKPQVYRAGVISDLQCRAWAELGNAYRVAEDLGEAEHAFCRAESFFEQGTHDETLQARLLDLRASYYGDRREFELAFAALDTIFTIYSRNGNHHLAGRALITKGLHLSYKGDADEAIQTIRKGLSLIDADKDPSLHFAAVHNLARSLMEKGKFREARKALSRNVWRQQEAGGPLNLLKLKWVDAQINVGLQQFERAEFAFLEVKQGFLEVNKPYDAAVASLDLATLWLSQGRTTDAKVASLEAYEMFRSLGIRREGTGAFLVLMKAFQMGTATAKLVKSVAEHLRKAQNDPAARFEPPGE